MKQLIYCLALLCPLVTPAQHTALSIGNSLPPLQVQLLNNSNTANLFSQYKGKALIIDFFATWCSNCVYAVPELNRIQQSFKDQLQVVLVSVQSAAVLQNFLPKNRYTKANKLPVIAADTVLAKLFPHLSIPHQVWVNPDGIIKAITSGKQLTMQNVEALIKGLPLNLPVKQDRLNHDPAAPLFFTATTNEVKAAFGEPLTGLQRMSVIQSTSGMLRFTMVNQTIIGLYRSALHKNTGKKIILEVNDSSRFLPLAADPEVWKNSYTHCFEIIAPPSYSPQQLRRHMLQQLNSFFNCKAAITVRSLPCLFLQTTSKGITPAAATVLPQTITGSELVWSLTNQPINHLCEWFNRASPYDPLEGLPYVVNQTGYAGNIDIALTAQHIRQANLKAINNELAAFGLQLVPGNIQTEVLLITDNNKPKNQ